MAGPLGGGFLLFARLDLRSDAVLFIPTFIIRQAAVR